MPSKQHPARFTDEQLLEQLRTLSENLGGKIPTSHDIMYTPDVASYTAFHKRFGSFNHALELAGFKPNPLSRRYTKEQIKTAIKECRKALGKIPTRDDYILWRETSRNQHRMPGMAIILIVCESWNKAAIMTFQKRYTGDRVNVKEKALAALRRFMRASDGNPPSAGRYLEWRQTAPDNEDLPQVKTIYNYFGTWREALDAAMRKYPDICRFSRAQVASALMECSLAFGGKVPSPREYQIYRNAAPYKYDMPDIGDICLVYGIYPDATKDVFGENRS